MTDLTNLFPQWGEDGVLPSNGFFYSGGDQVSAENLNALWNGVQEQSGQLISGVRNRVRDLTGDVVLDAGLVASIGTNARDVDVSASQGAYVDGQKVDSVSATTLTLSAGGPRTDSVHLTTGGTLGLSEGTTTVADNRLKVAEVDLSAADEVEDVRNVANDHQIDYVTETEPSDASVGDTWLNLATDRLQVYQGGAFREVLTEQDNVTINAGTALSGGGELDLQNGSVTLNVDDVFVSNTGDTINGDLDVTGTLSESSNNVLTTADEGSGNGLDADTVDGQNANEIGISVANFATESGSFTNEDGARTVSLANTYESSAFIPSVGATSASPDDYGGIKVTSVNTNGNGNVVSFTYETVENFGNADVTWNVMGIVV